MDIKKIWITTDAVHILTEDGREAKEFFSDYPRFRNAPREALEDFTADNFGIHWNQLNEDLSFDGFFIEKPKNPLRRLLMSFPEINVSALARRMGISQTQMAQYLGSVDAPPCDKTEEILSELRKIGMELSRASL